MLQVKTEITWKEVNVTDPETNTTKTVMIGKNGEKSVHNHFVRNIEHPRTFQTA